MSHDNSYDKKQKQIFAWGNFHRALEGAGPVEAFSFSMEKKSKRSFNLVKSSERDAGYH